MTDTDTTATLRQMNERFVGRTREGVTINLATGRAVPADETQRLAADVARYILANAQELADLRGEPVDAGAVQDMAAMVAVAGLPAGGPGMAAEAEWADWQIELLDRYYYGTQADDCNHAVGSDCPHYS